MGDARRVEDAVRTALSEWHKNDWLFDAVDRHFAAHNDRPIIECREAECVAAVDRANGVLRGR